VGRGVLAALVAELRGAGLEVGEAVVTESGLDAESEHYDVAVRLVVNGRHTVRGSVAIK
jgi:hypothetical protein